MKEKDDLTKEKTKSEKETESSRKSYDILVVDDDLWIQRIFSKYLVEWGLNPISAYTPYEAVALAVKRLPLVVFLDIVMPEVTGEIIMKMLKAIDKVKEIPIVVVSANFDKEILKETYRLGAADFLSKPVNKKLIFESLKKTLPKEVIEELSKTTFKLSE